MGLIHLRWMFSCQLWESAEYRKKSVSTRWHKTKGISPRSWAERPKMTRECLALTFVNSSKNRTTKTRKLLMLHCTTQTIITKNPERPTTQDLSSNRNIGKPLLPSSQSDQLRICFQESPQERPHCWPTMQTTQSLRVHCRLLQRFLLIEMDRWLRS